MGGAVAGVFQQIFLKDFFFRKTRYSEISSVVSGAVAVFDCNKIYILSDDRKKINTISKREYSSCL